MRKSYYPNYFSLEDIMASEERIPVEVKRKISSPKVCQIPEDNCMA